MHVGCGESGIVKVIKQNTGHVLQSGLVIHNIEDAHQYLCNINLESFSNVVGITPSVRRPVIEFTGHRVTAIKVTTVHENTVAFLGTSFGRLKKVSC